MHVSFVISGSDERCRKKPVRQQKHGHTHEPGEYCDDCPVIQRMHQQDVETKRLIDELYTPNGVLDEGKPIIWWPVWNEDSLTRKFTYDR